jgi:hypothetical protein
MGKQKLREPGKTQIRALSDILNYGSSGKTVRIFWELGEVIMGVWRGRQKTSRGLIMGEGQSGCPKVSFHSTFIFGENLGSRIHYPQEGPGWPWSHCRYLVTMFLTFDLSSIYMLSLCTTVLSCSDAHWLEISDSYKTNRVVNKTSLPPYSSGLQSGSPTP